jgi:hypothetical protein
MKGERIIFFKIVVDNNPRVWDTSYMSRAHNGSQAELESRKAATQEDKVAKDILVANHGSLVILKPVSEAGKNWLAENIGEDNGYQPMFPSIIAEPRYVEQILEGACNDGLTLGWGY